MRRLPKDSDEIFDKVKEISPDLQRKDSEGKPTIKRQVRKYELITPLFGGGVEAGKPDLQRLITGKSVRGQLRFWWRAIRGGFGNSQEGLAKMKKKEAELWGAASTNEFASASEVNLVVNVTSTRSQREWPFSNQKAVKGWKELAYAAFPLQEEEGFVVSGVQFTLTISYREADKEDVEAALWAWETFGGIGARTRRGFGAIKKVGDSWPAKVHKIEERIRKQLELFTKGLDEWHADVPHLSQNLSFVIVTKEENRNRAPFESGNEAWEKLVQELKGFRQSRDEKGFGRNKWPEPEQIRRITKQRFTEHVEDKAMLGIQKFPRAAFGLPIIFHFKDEDKNPPDPADTTLKGGLIKDSPPGKLKYRERLASPLILRPLACGNNGVQAVGLAVILQTPRFPSEGLILTGQAFSEVVEPYVNKAQAKQIESLKKVANTLPNDDDVVDVLEAFLNSLREKEAKKEKQS